MKNKGWIPPISAIIILIIFTILPPFNPLTTVGMKVIGIFLFTVILWIFVGVGYTSFICIALFPLFGLMSAIEVFAASMGNWIVMFVIACLGLAESLKTTGLSKRIALWFMSRSFTIGRPWYLFSMLMLSATILASLITSMAALVVLIPIVEPMLKLSGLKKGDRFAATVMMGLAWAVTSAFMMTPIGHGANVLLIDWVERDTGYTISFINWMLVGIPIGFILLIVIMVFLRYIINPDVSQFGLNAIDYIIAEKKQLGTIKIEEKISSAVFLLVLASWFLPTTVSMFPNVTIYFKNLGYAVPAMIGCGILCFLRVNGKPLLNFQRWMSNIEWSSILLIAAIMLIGKALSKPETGIFQFLTTAISPLAIKAPFFIFLLISILWPSLQTNIMSNLVTATLVYSIIVPTVIEVGIANPAAMGFSIFAATRSAFALPSATVVTALVIGSGWVPVKFMLRYGAIVTIPVALVIIFFCYPLASIIFR